LAAAYANAENRARLGQQPRFPVAIRCWPGQGCTSYTGFRSDTSGRITDFLVNGQSTPLAIGKDSTGSSGLAVTDVSADVEDQTGTTVVVFRVRNLGQQAIGSYTPAFLPVFVTPDGSQFSYDSSTSVLPGPLLAGESVAAIAVFHMRTIIGQFTLRTNDQTEQVLVRTTLHMS
jgi:hypothetical protein